MKSGKWLWILRTCAVFAFFGAAIAAFPHCDTMDGPVITAARSALDKKDITPVLKWIRGEDEKEIREAFKKALAVRSNSTASQDLADQFFFETVVRLHRASEGEPFTGLKGPDSIDALILQADAAITSGSVESLANEVAETTANGLRDRFAKVIELRKHADENVASGRAYVAAYVEYMHFLERVHAIAHESAAGHHE